VLGAAEATTKVLLRPVPRTRNLTGQLGAAETKLTAAETRGQTDARGHTPESARIPIAWFGPIGEPTATADRVMTAAGLLHGSLDARFAE